MTAIAGMGAVCVWRVRRHTRLLRWAAVVAYILLDIVMTRPAYYIVTRLDVTGSSTGWHRAKLIESAIARDVARRFRGDQLPRRLNARQYDRDRAAISAAIVPDRSIDLPFGCGPPDLRR